MRFLLLVFCLLLIGCNELVSSDYRVARAVIVDKGYIPAHLSTESAYDPATESVVTKEVYHSAVYHLRIKYIYKYDYFVDYTVEEYVYNGTDVGDPLLVTVEVKTLRDQKTGRLSERVYLKRLGIDG